MMILISLHLDYMCKAAASSDQQRGVQREGSARDLFPASFRMAATPRLKVVAAAGQLRHER